MKKIILGFLAIMSFSGFATTAPQMTAINVSNKRPLQISDVTGLTDYATHGNYYLSVNLHAGMAVSFSASYGIGNEAAQASGTIVQKNGKFWYQQDTNPGVNLLLPPGLASNSSDGTSLWDIGAYMALINRVTFSQPNAASLSTSNVYDGLQGYLVDFQGGTAGNTVSYTDAMEIDMNKTVTGGTSTFQVYYAKGIGPVALQFEETAEPSGTFEFYLGQ
jgi:hypothetical protein